MKQLIFLIILFSHSIDGLCQEFVENQKLVPDGIPDLFAERFGNCLDIDGDIAVVGSELGGKKGQFITGIVTIYQRDTLSGKWHEIRRINPDHRSRKSHSEYIGTISIYSVSLSGAYLLVGTETRKNSNVTNSSTFIYKKDKGGINNWGLIKKLEIQDGIMGGDAGHIVSIDKEVAVVRAATKSDNFMGFVHIFYKDEGGTDNWGHVKNLELKDAQGTYYKGSRVSISGNTIIIGAHGEVKKYGRTVKNGLAFIFVKDEGGLNNWGQVAMLRHNGRPLPDFGRVVSIEGDHAIVCSISHAFIFNKDEGGLNNWGQVAKLSGPSSLARFERQSIPIGIDGDLAIIGGDNNGGAFVYHKDTGGTNNWGLLTKISPPDSLHSAQFGQSVAISGNHVLIGDLMDETGGYQHGSAFIFEQDNMDISNWERNHKLERENGFSRRAFGKSVSISHDFAAIGASGAMDGGWQSGSVFIYHIDEEGKNNWGQVTELKAPDPQKYDRFGFSTSLSGDYLIVGSIGYDGKRENLGAAYIFKKEEGSGNKWNNLVKLVTDSSETIYNFGWSVSIDNDLAIVKAGKDQFKEEWSGLVYVFQKDKGGKDNWGQVAKILPNKDINPIGFGNNIFLSNDILVVSCSSNSSNENSGNIACMYQKDKGGKDNWGLVKIISLEGKYVPKNIQARSVSVDENLLVVGVVGLGTTKVHVFEKDKGGKDNWGHVARLDAFGEAVSISKDYILAGNFNYSDTGPYSGSAFLFYKDEGGKDNWGQIAKLKSSVASSYDYFGESVCIDGDQIIVGSPRAFVGGFDSGAAYFFNIRELISSGKLDKSK